jgi:hypothetical protein
MDRLVSAIWWSIFDACRTSRKCAAPVAAKRWEDARRGAQREAGGQHLTLQAGPGGECGGGGWRNFSSERERQELRPAACGKGLSGGGCGGFYAG